MCELLSKLTSVKTNWTWNRMYQDLYDKAKQYSQKDAYMKFYNVGRPIYPKTDTSTISLGAGLLLVRDGMKCGCCETLDSVMLHPTAFASKSLSTAYWCCSNIEYEALRIQYGLEKCPHYFFMRVVCIITDHKPLVVMLSKDVAMLSQL